MQNHLLKDGLWRNVTQRHGITMYCTYRRSCMRGPDAWIGYNLRNIDDVMFLLESKHRQLAQKKKKHLWKASANPKMIKIYGALIKVWKMISDRKISKRTWMNETQWNISRKKTDDGDVFLGLFLDFILEHKKVKLVKKLLVNNRAASVR